MSCRSSVASASPAGPGYPQRLSFAQPLLRVTAVLWGEAAALLIFSAGGKGKEIRENNEEEEKEKERSDARYIISTLQNQELAFEEKPQWGKKDARKDWF